MKKTWLSGGMTVLKFQILHEYMTFKFVKIQHIENHSFQFQLKIKTSLNPLRKQEHTRPDLINNKINCQGMA